MEERSDEERPIEEACSMSASCGSSSPLLLPVELPLLLLTGATAGLSPSPLKLLRMLEERCVRMVRTSSSASADGFSTSSAEAEAAAFVVVVHALVGRVGHGFKGGGGGAVVLTELREFGKELHDAWMVLRKCV